MNKIRQKSRLSSVWFYIAGFLLAGALHSADRLTVASMNGGAAADSAAKALFSTVLFTLNLSIYFFMIVCWFLSVRTRLLPSRGRTYLSIAAIMMAFFLLDRVVKYRIAAEGSALKHIAWYAYYIPLAMIPTLFLLTCLGFDPKSPRKKRARAVLSLFCALLVLAVATNDFHKLMFRPMGNIEQGGGWGTYSTGPVWILFYAYIVLCVIAGTVFLAVADRRAASGRRTLPSVLLLILMLIMLTVLERFVPLSPWVFPEIAVFSMLGILENCIQTRLIPSNENYRLFFEHIRFPALITDRELKPVFRTASGGTIPSEMLAKAIETPTETKDGKVLYGKPLSSGYVFFISDESGIRALNDSLADVMDALEGENELLRFENQQKDERARIDARNSVYAKASKEVYEVQKRIAGYLDKAEKGEESKKNTAKALLLNAYVKRRTNFLLSSAEQEAFSAEELFLALDESMRFLVYCGIQTGVERQTKRTFSYREVCALYDTFEMLIESLPASVSALSLTLGDGTIRMLTDCRDFSVPPDTPAAVSVQNEEGQLYLTLTVKEDAP